MFQKNPKFKQGIYTPINKEKFDGQVAIYRSSYELKLFQFLDLNKNVVKWSSENIIIPYRSPIDGKIHRYYADNVVHIKEGNEVVKYLIEIKPFKQTLPPEPSTRKKKSTVLYEQLTYAINQAKWEAAKDYCKNRGYKWLVITERELLL